MGTLYIPVKKYSLVLKNYKEWNKFCRFSSLQLFYFTNAGIMLEIKTSSFMTVQTTGSDF
jgi:Na+/H+ antiporter NhaA